MRGGGAAWRKNVKINPPVHFVWRGSGRDRGKLGSVQEHTGWKGGGGKSEASFVDAIKNRWEHWKNAREALGRGGEKKKIRQSLGLPCFRGGDKTGWSSWKTARRGAPRRHYLAEQASVAKAKKLGDPSTGGKYC